MFLHLALIPIWFNYVPLAIVVPFAGWVSYRMWQKRKDPASYKLTPVTVVGILLVVVVTGYRALNH